MIEFYIEYDRNAHKSNPTQHYLENFDFLFKKEWFNKTRPHGACGQSRQANADIGNTSRKKKQNPMCCDGHSHQKHGEIVLARNKS